jgi:ribosomal protein S5
MGNCNGVIGYGKGGGLDFEDALDKAVNDCKKNLVAINLDHFLPSASLISQPCNINLLTRKY